MTRRRTTWAAYQKTADPYLMNQDHVNQQPGAGDYLTGDPSSWKEDVNPENRWEDEYKGDQVARDEIGMGEMRSETFNHPEKTANMDRDYLLKKASVCEKVARRMLGRTASDAAIEDQSLALMDLSDADLLGTYDRLANDQQGQGQEEQKQAQQQMPAQGQQQQGQQAQQQQMTQAQQQEMQAQQQAEQAMQQAMQAMAQGDQVVADQAMQQAVDAQSKCAGMTVAKAASFVARKFATLMVKANQGQQMPFQGQQQAQQGQQQQMPAQGQQQQAPAQAQQQMPAQGQQQQMPAQDQQQQQGQDQQMLESMLMEGDPEMAEFDVELEAPEMGLDVMDQDLSMVFAGQEAQDAQQGQQAQEGQNKEARGKTASRKPVAKLGGAPSSQTMPTDVGNLSSMWKSAPDVSKVFFGGLPSPWASKAEPSASPPSAKRTQTRFLT